MAYFLQFVTGDGEVLKGELGMRNAEKKELWRTIEGDHRRGRDRGMGRSEGGIGNVASGLSEL
jgi:hypothetical protein